jgi:hypothetical protein
MEGLDAGVTVILSKAKDLVAIAASVLVEMA